MSKYFLLIVLTLLCLVGCGTLAPTPIPTPTSMPTPTPEWVVDGWDLVWQDEFVGGAWPGYPDDTNTFPQTIKFDYIRIYEKPPVNN